MLFAPPGWRRLVSHITDVPTIEYRENQLSLSAASVFGLIRIRIWADAPHGATVAPMKRLSDVRPWRCTMSMAPRHVTGRC